MELRNNKRAVDKLINLIVSIKFEYLNFVFVSRTQRFPLIKTTRIN